MLGEPGNGRLRHRQQDDAAILQHTGHLQVVLDVIAHALRGPPLDDLLQILVVGGLVIVGVGHAVAGVGVLHRGFVQELGLGLLDDAAELGAQAGAVAELELALVQATVGQDAVLVEVQTDQALRFSDLRKGHVIEVHRRQGRALRDPQLLGLRHLHGVDGLSLLDRYLILDQLRILDGGGDVAGRGGRGSRSGRRSRRSGRDKGLSWGHGRRSRYLTTIKRRWGGWRHLRRRGRQTNGSRRLGNGGGSGTGDGRGHGNGHRKTPLCCGRVWLSRYRYRVVSLRTENH